MKFKLNETRKSVFITLQHNQRDADDWDESDVSREDAAEALENVIPEDDYQYSKFGIKFDDLKKAWSLCVRNGTPLENYIKSIRTIFFKTNNTPEKCLAVLDNEGVDFFLTEYDKEEFLSLDMDDIHKKFDEDKFVSEIFTNLNTRVTLKNLIKILDHKVEDYIDNHYEDFI